MKITRHFLDVNGRTVHYRACGSGPVLLLIHQSPRSSAEYERLMLKWGEHFTCIAPDSPGYGQSDPLEIELPDINDMGDGLIEFLDAIGLEKVGAYGFHTGGAIAMNAHVRYPGRFVAFVTGGYPIWTEEEMALFAAEYLPEFKPSAYGEHLAWLWSRILEQSWFFPWFKIEMDARLARPHDDVTRVDAIVHEMLDSGDFYRRGYRAALSAGSDIPSPMTVSNPVLIATYRADPLFPHLARLPVLPAGWSVESVESPTALEELALEFLQRFPLPSYAELKSDKDRGFVSVNTPTFSGVIHWCGNLSAETLFLHGPGESMELLPDCEGLLIDLPGHGLSSDFSVPADLSSWADVIVGATQELGATRLIKVVGHQLSALLALKVGAALGAGSVSGTDAHIPVDGEAWIAAQPDLTPDRFGGYLQRAWQVIRARQFFWPWFEVKGSNAIPFAESQTSPTYLAIAHRALMRARSGSHLTEVLLRTNRDELVANAPHIDSWQTAPWASKRTDIWRPGLS